MPRSCVVTRTPTHTLPWGKKKAFTRSYAEDVFFLHQLKSCVDFLQLSWAVLAIFSLRKSPLFTDVM